jgi:hypothetical protein
MSSTLTTNFSKLTFTLSFTDGTSYSDALADVRAALARVHLPKTQVYHHWPRTRSSPQYADDFAKVMTEAERMERRGQHRHRRFSPRCLRTGLQAPAPCLPDHQVLCVPNPAASVRALAQRVK